MNNQNHSNCRCNGADFGPEPFVTNINNAARQNCNFRTTLWTGNNLQCTLMSIPVCGEIGLENHSDIDQCLCVEEGCGCVMMGSTRDRLNFQTNVCKDSAVFVPAGTWHNLVNTGDCPLKLFSIYAPPAHPSGTVNRTKADADMAERYHL